MTGGSGPQHLPGTLVRCTAEGDALARHRVDLTKIDVEGGEMAVLAGLEATVACWSRLQFQVRPHTDRT